MATFGKDYAGYDEAIASVEAEDLMSGLEGAQEMVDHIEGLPDVTPEEVAQDPLIAENRRAAIAGASGQPRQAVQATPLPDVETTETIAKKPLPGQSAEYRRASDAVFKQREEQRKFEEERLALEEESAQLAKESDKVAGDINAPAPEGFGEARAFTALPDAGTRDQVDAEVAAVAEESGQPVEKMSAAKSRLLSVASATDKGLHDKLMVDLQNTIETTQDKKNPNGTKSFGDRSRSAMNRAELANQIMGSLTPEEMQNLSEEDIQGIYRALQRAGRYDMSSQRAGELVERYVDNIKDNIALSENYVANKEKAAARRLAIGTADQADSRTSAQLEQQASEIERMSADAAKNSQESKAINDLVESGKFGEALTVQTEATIAKAKGEISAAGDITANEDLRRTAQELELLNKATSSRAQAPMLESHQALAQSVQAWQEDPSPENQAAMMAAINNEAARSEIYDNLDAQTKDRREQSYQTALGRLSTMANNITQRQVSISADARRAADEAAENGRFGGETDEGYQTAYNRFKDDYIRQMVAASPGLKQMQDAYATEAYRVRTDLLPYARKDKSSTIENIMKDLKIKDPSKADESGDAAIAGSTKAAPAFEADAEKIATQSETELATVVEGISSIDLSAITEQNLNAPSQKAKVFTLVSDQFSDTFADQEQLSQFVENALGKAIAAKKETLKSAEERIKVLSSQGRRMSKSEREAVERLRFEIRWLENQETGKIRR